MCGDVPLSSLWWLSWSKIFSSSQVQTMEWELMVHAVETFVAKKVPKQTRSATKRMTQQPNMPPNEPSTATTTTLYQFISPVPEAHYTDALVTVSQPISHTIAQAQQQA